MLDYMLDLETLSTAPDAMVFEVAVVPFTPHDIGGGKVWKILPKTGAMDPETVAWWLRQERRPELTTGLHEGMAAHRVADYFKTLPKDSRLWAKPTSFDCVILQQFLKRYGQRLAIDFRQWRDVRTLLKTFPRVSLPTMNKECEHDPLMDAAHQAQCVQAVWKEITK